ncbi:MAG TPA: type IV pilin protein [Herbaspirillum sp.]|jgi:type IV pilus assembly protein PilE
MRTPSPSRQSAFTLIEIMTVLLIISILSAFAYPSYRQAKLKTARAEGRAALMRLMQQQEREYTQKHRYQRFSVGDETTSFLRFSGASGTDKASAYRLDARACETLGQAGSQADDQDCILLRAIPAPSFSDPLCNILTLDSTGKQGVDNEAGAATDTDGCW